MPARPVLRAGAILAEAVRWEPSLRAVGLDRSSDALVRRGGRHRGIGGGLAGPRRRRLPADPARAFDRVVTNPPWGGQAPFLGRAGRDTIVAMVDEACAGDGHAVVLVDELLDEEPRVVGA